MAGLRELYRKRHGDEKGYADYLARVQRASLASSRIGSPSRPDGFVLEDLKGNKVSLDEPSETGT